MKLELQCGDSITIPEGCKAQINGNEVVIEKEKKEEAKTQEFKDGDVLTSLFDNKVVFIFKENESKQKYNKNDYYVCHTYVSYSAGYVIEVPTKDSLYFCGHKEDVRHATNEEKQLLFDKMKEQGLRWNAEEKQVEKLRWRAKNGEYYYHINGDGFASAMKDTDYISDRYRYNFGNYFRTKEQTEEAAKRVQETLLNYHKELNCGQIQTCRY